MHRTEAVVRRLRRECAFNGARIPQDLVAALRDEIGELSEAIESGAAWTVADELGDVLFTVLSLALAIEDVYGVTIDEADDRAARKMTGRHPYVFGDAADPGPELAPTLWQQRKLEEDLESIANRTAVIGTGIVTLSDPVPPEEQADLAEVLCQHLAPFDEGAAPIRSSSSTHDGRSVTLWVAPDTNQLAYSLIGGPATDPRAAVVAFESLSPTDHYPHLREMPRV